MSNALLAQEELAVYQYVVTFLLFVQMTNVHTTTQK